MSEQEVTVTIHADVSRFIKAVNRASASMHAASVAWMFPSRRRRHLVRCGICSPMANPRPLSIDGHAYRRKVNARRKRR